jgi:glutaredoxin-related protein
MLHTFFTTQLYIKGEFVGGSDILMGLHRSGDLRTLLSDGPKEHAPA